MADTAAHLVDFVIPHVPVRQWVLSLPRPLRFILARDSKLITRATNVFVSEIFHSQRQRADLPRLSDAECGAVTGVQRFGGALNLNVHLHSLVLDGVYPKGDLTSFRRTPEPSQEELMEVLERTRSRITAWLRRKGFAWESEEGGGEGDELSVQDVIQAASIRECHPAEARRVHAGGPAFLSPRVARRAKADGSGRRTRRGGCSSWGTRRRGRSRRARNRSR